MLIEKILNFLKTNKKTLFYIAFIAVFFMISTDGVFATEGAETTWKSESTDLYNALIQTVSTGIGMLSSIVGLFLNPSWTNGTGIWLHVHLKDLWIMISNIVYVIFAFLLIIIAFMNIIWKWDKWELKQALPKFFIWVLIVPFSWMFVQVVIAISSFLSVSVLMLPYDVLSNSPTNSWEEIKAKPVCTTYIVVSKSQGKDQSANTANTSWCGGTTPIAELLKSDGVYGLLNIYTYGIFSLDQLSQINGQEVDSFTSLFKIGINLIVILLFAIIYFILMVSLCLALFVRWMWLWMYMIFSPVFGLLYFFDKSKDGFMEGKFSISEFVSLAMVPVYVSAALAFGLLFIFVAGSSFSDESDSDGFVDYKDEPVTFSDYPGTSSGAEISKEAWNGQRITILENFNLDMYGDFVTSWKQTDGLFDVMKSGFGTLLMQLFGLAVLWVAVMAAINQSKITQAVVEPIASFGKQVGGLIQKSPQYAPIFGGQSMQSIQQVWGKITGAANQVSIDKANNFSKKLPFLNESSVDRTSKLQEISNRIETNYGNSNIASKSLKNEFIEILKAADWDASNMVNSPDFKTAFQSLGKKVGLTTGELANFDFKDESKIADTVIRQIEGKFDDKTIGLLDGVWKNWWTFGKSELSDLVSSVQKWDIKNNSNVIDDKIQTTQEKAWNVNYYNISIWWDSVGNVSDGKLVDIPWLLDIEQQISKISDKLTSTYQWDINNSETLKKHINDELYIKDEDQVDNIIKKVQKKDNS